MHYAKLYTSARLQRVLEFLSDYKTHTTRDIIIHANVCAVNSIIGELRLNGFYIDCKMITKGRFEYQLRRREKMKIYLKINNEWKLLKGKELEKELKKQNISIGANSYIGEKSRIGVNSNIGANSYIGEGSIIGANSNIGANSRIDENSNIGARSNIGEKSRIGVNSWIGENSNIVSILNGYKYNANAYIDAKTGKHYVRLGCYIRTVEEWDKNFNNNPKEFSEGSKELERRRDVYEFLKNHLQMEEAK